jgi:hypothetical protein
VGGDQKLDGCGGAGVFLMPAATLVDSVGRYR